MSNDKLLMKVARVLSDRAANECGVDKDDSWKEYGFIYIGDAYAVLATVRAHDLNSRGKGMSTNERDALERMVNGTEADYKHLFTYLASVIDPTTGRTADMHARVRSVLKHHQLTKHGDGIIEADLIEAVLDSIRTQE